MTSQKFPTTPLPPEFGGSSYPGGLSADGDRVHPAPAPAPAPAAPVYDATPAQLDFLRDLANGREITEDHRRELLARIEARTITKARASDWIGRLKEKPRRKGATKSGGRFPVRFETMELDGGKTMELGFVDVNGREVPQGKYALLTAELGGEWTNDIAFFNLYVARGDDGPFYSLKMYVSDDLVKMPNARQREILAAIAEDPAAASKLYGIHRVRCGVCNRKLTNDLSREIGIGPVCRERLGW